MVISRVLYPATSITKKYKVIRDGVEYSCYINPFSGNIVVTGDGKSDQCKNITNTKIGREIILACGKGEQ